MILLLFRTVVKVVRERVESSCVWRMVTRVTDFVFVHHKIEPQTPGIPHTKPTQKSVTPSALSFHTRQIRRCPGTASWP